MRWLLVTFSAVLLFGGNPELRNVKSVYLLPMSNGMDQYLANRLQTSDLYVVTSDPQAADAVFTDALGPAFEQKFAELYPVEKEDEEAPKQEERTTSFRRGHGMVFLVERKSRQVVWSTFENPKNSSPDQLDKAARRITERLKQSLDPKKAN